MSRPVQGTVRGGSLVRTVGFVVTIMAGCAALSACGGGFGMSRVDADPTILTGAVPPDPERLADPQKASDEATIRNAVSSANLEELKGQPLAWANVDTDSRGAITRIVETRAKGYVCRSFTVSRESFEGVALHRGEACAGADGAWWMRSFKDA